MVIRVSDKKQNYNNVTKLLVKPILICLILNDLYFIRNRLIHDII